MHMVSKKDLNSAELETMGTSRSPTTVMTANGEVQTREEATVQVKELDLFVTAMLLEDTPTVLSLGKLCKDHGYTYHWISGQKSHLTMKGKRTDCNVSNVYHLWFLISQLLRPRLHLHLLLHHLHHRIPYLLSTGTPKIQYKKEVEVRVESFGETRCMKPQKPKTKIKMVNANKYKEIYASLATGIQREFGWWKYFIRALGKLRARKSRHFQIISWTSNWAESKSGTGFGYARFEHALSKGPKLWYLLEDDNNKGFLLKTCWYSRAQSGTFWRFDTVDHKVLSEESESRNNHRYAVVVQDLATQWRQSYPCKSKSSRKNLMKFLEPDEETKSHLHWQFLGLWQVLRGIILESLYVNWGSSALS